MQVVPASSAHFLRYRSVVSWTGDVIRRRRDALGLTQAQLADRVGASLRAVSSWESDDTQPQRKFRVELDRVLGPPPTAGSDPSRSVDLTALSNSQIVVLMAQLAAEVGIRMGDADDDARPVDRTRGAVERVARGSKYYPVGEMRRPNLREELGPYIPSNEERREG